MKLIVGLGNPGSKYELTRHNVGFLAIDRLVERWAATGPTSKHEGIYYQANFGGEKVLLLKPQTFMNLSGRSVAPLFNFHKLEPTDLVIIHDDLDLESMRIRIKTGGGSGGHNGIKSIDECIGKANNGYHRVRVGIGRGGHSAIDHVLAAYSNTDLKELDIVLDRIAEASELIVKGQMGDAMTNYNRKFEE